DSSRGQPRIIARRRACDAHGEQLGRALTVPRDRPREPLRHLQQRAQQHFRLWAARADGALPAAPLASIKNVSLVELSPSTVTWLKLRSATALTIEAIRP